jgi:glucose/arabinose dehydrogenase
VVETLRHRKAGKNTPAIHHAFIAGLVAGVAASFATRAAAQQLTTVRVANGLTRPIYVTAPPGDTGRLFVVEQRGSGGVAGQAQIKILNLATGTINATPFLTINPVATGGEQGVLSLAFDPNYGTNRRFFVFSINTAWASVITRYTASEANPDIANPAGSVILTQSHEGEGHNGGWMGFGPDGFLYIALGDGGPWFDPNGYGQNLGVLFGKILRLDASGAMYSIPATNPFAGSTTNRPEIWAYGLRNPWRNSFDRVTGDLWVADVGQDLWEEVNVQPRPVSPPFAAANFGWRCYEANAVQNATVGPGGALCSSLSGFTFPIHTYDHSLGCSITGGYVYRGRAMPYLRGKYFFADFCSSRIWSLEYAGGTAQHVTDRTAELARPGFTIDQIVSFGEDGNGEIYICDFGGGEVHRIVPRCPANCDGSTGAPLLSGNDFLCFLNLFAAQDPYANCDGSSTSPVLTANDFQCFLNLYAAGCS